MALNKTIHAWSVDAGSNAAPETPINFAEQQLAQTLNNSMRATLASIAATFIDGYADGVALSGTSTAYTVTVNQGLDSLPTGLVLIVLPNVTCGDNPTLNVNSIGAKSLLDYGGGSITAGDLIEGRPYQFRYNGTDFVATVPVNGAAGISSADIKLLMIEVAKLKADQIGLSAGVVDDFEDSDGVDAGSSTGEVYDSDEGYYTNEQTPANNLPNMTGASAPSGHVASSSSNISGFDAWKAFDSDTSSTYWRPSALPAWVQRQLPSAITVTHYSISASTTASGAPTAWTLSGSNNGSSFTTIDTQSSVSWSTTSGVETKTFEVPLANQGSYTYYRLNITAGGSIVSTELYLPIAHLGLLEQPSTPDLDLRSVSYTATSAPSSASIFVIAKGEDGDTITANTNLVAKATRDGGTTWSDFTLQEVGELSSGYKLYEGNGLSLSSQPSGTSMKWRIETDTAPVVRVDAVVFSWG